jgi:uncharacterized protein (UPF0303 family)
MFKKGQNMSEIFPTSQDLIAQAQTLIYPQFDETTAWALGADLVARAQEAQLGIVISIRTPNRCLFHAALPGSAALNDLWARRKSNTAFIFGKASLLVGCIHREKGQDLARNGLSLTDYADHGGAVPVMVAGVGLAAVVTVSGLPQVQDHEMVVAAMQAQLAQMSQIKP